MRLPRIKTIYTTSNTIGTFGGLNESAVCPDAEFAAMKNMSSRFYPAIGTRKPRGGGPTGTHTGNGMIYVDGIFEVHSTTCTYKDVTIAGLTVENSPKTLVKMGAVILIFPDRKFYNTATGEQGNLFWRYNSAEVDNAPTITISGDDTYTRFTVPQNSAPVPGFFSGLYAGDAIKIENKKIVDNGDDTYTDYTTYNGTHLITNMVDAVEYEEVYDVQTQITTIVKKTNTHGFDIGVPFQSSSPTSWTTMPYLFEREVPDMEIVFECNNRVWGAHYSTGLNEIYASKLGDPKDWKVFEGTALDSYSLSVGSGDAWTGGINFNGQPLFMKENFIFIMYGDKPSNFQLVTKPVTGALWPKSLVLIGQVLYYAARDGIYVFDGTSPKKISEKLKHALTDVVAGERDGKYYMSCHVDGDSSKKTLYCYDPQTGIWTQEDDAWFKCVAKAQGHLYYIDGSNASHDIASDTDSEWMEWMLESGDMAESSLEMKYISKFRFNLWLAQGSYARFQMRYDDGEWCDSGIIRSTENKTYSIPIIPKRCSKYRWRISGKGDMKLLGVGREVEGGSDLNGNA